MRRAARSARAVVKGDVILKMIQEQKTRRLLVKAAESGAVPVTAISGKLLEQIGARDAKLLPIRQFVGLCVRAVLEEEGFALAESGVRVSNDPVFRTGSTYRRSENGTNHHTDLLDRIIERLTDQEASRALDLLLRRKR